MTRITLDATTLAKFKDTREMVELCDDAGRVWGHFLPGPPRDQDGNIIVPFSEEELEAMDKQQGGRPLREIFDDLSKL